MKCPFCNHENTRVIDSRPAEDNNSIRRRRICDECGKRFTTYEKIETIPLIIIKKDNNRETYDRTKIEAGVLRACHKRPVSAKQLTTLIDEVEKYCNDAGYELVFKVATNETLPDVFHKVIATHRKIVAIMASLLTFCPKSMGRPKPKYLLTPVGSYASPGS